MGRRISDRIARAGYIFNLLHLVSKHGGCTNHCGALRIYFQTVSRSRRILLTIRLRERSKTAVVPSWCVELLPTYLHIEPKLGGWPSKTNSTGKYKGIKIVHVHRDWHG